MANKLTRVHIRGVPRPRVFLLRAIERIEAALILVDDSSYPTSAFFIERARDQMRADAWPDTIDDAPAARNAKKLLDIACPS